MGYRARRRIGYLVQLDIWLVLTLLFANFASAIAEARGKAQADALRKTRQETPARRLRNYHKNGSGGFEGRGWQRGNVSSSQLKGGDFVLVEAGQVIPSDGEIIEGVASIDESAITGESAPVIREAGGDRSGVTGGTRVLSDGVVVQITAAQGNTFLDRMIALVEGAIRQRTPNEIALSLVLAAFTLIFLIVTATLWPMACNAEQYMSSLSGTPVKSLGTDVPTLVALLVCLIPTTIGALLGGHRHRRHGSGPAGQHPRQERQGGGSGRRRGYAAVGQDRHHHRGQSPRHAVHSLGDTSPVQVAYLTALASSADETPEGKSIVALYHKLNDSQRAGGQVHGRRPARSRPIRGSFPFPPKPA